MSDHRTLGFCRRQANFGWPMSDDRLLFAALTIKGYQYNMSKDRAIESLLSQNY